MKRDLWVRVAASVALVLVAVQLGSRAWRVVRTVRGMIEQASIEAIFGGQPAWFAGISLLQLAVYLMAIAALTLGEWLLIWNAARDQPVELELERRRVAWFAALTGMLAVLVMVRLAAWALRG